LGSSRGLGQERQQRFQARRLKLRRNAQPPAITQSIIRTLFGLLDLNVSPYSDDDIADAMLTVCPTPNADWPTDAQLEAVVAQLQHQPRKSN